MTASHASELYDAVNAWTASDNFFLSFALSGSGHRVLDLGCGTGEITRAIAEKGRTVMGVDPDGPSLEAARRKPGSQEVEWVEGTSGSIPPGLLFDVTIMSSNVAQEMIDDAELQRSLHDLAAHLEPGGRLAFDSRDPRARGWEAWTRDRSHKVVELPEGSVEHWYQTTSVDEETGLVEFCAHELNSDGVEDIICGPIRFRSEEKIRAMLEDAGFRIDEVYGGFAGEPVGRGIGSLVFTATRE